MSEMHDTENALARAVKAIYDASDLNREIQPLLAPLLDELLSTTSATSVRDVLAQHVGHAAHRLHRIERRAPTFRRS